MNTQTVILIISCSVLGIAVTVLLVKYLRLRAELGSFRDQVNEIRTTDREQPVKVASFGAPSVELAKEINQLVGELRTAALRSMEEEQRVRNIMAGVSHHFRTPLTAADGYLQMAGEILAKYDGVGTGQSALPESGYEGAETGQLAILEEMRSDLAELKEYLRIITERIRYLRALSDEFFEVTYLDAKKDIPLSEVRLDTVLSEVLLGQTEWLEERKAKMQILIPEEQFTVLADRHYLERILENLFSNAKKYMKSCLEVKVERMEEDSTIRLSMKNDVDPLTTIDPEQIFEPFYRAKGRSGSGTGLGLYVCRELADAMHFTIRGEVEDGVFTLSVTMPEVPRKQRSREG